MRGGGVGVVPVRPCVRKRLIIIIIIIITRFYGDNAIRVPIGKLVAGGRYYDILDNRRTLGFPKITLFRDEMYCAYYRKKTTDVFISMVMLIILDATLTSPLDTQ